MRNISTPKIPAPSSVLTAFSASSLARWFTPSMTFPLALNGAKHTRRMLSRWNVSTASYDRTSPSLFRTTMTATSLTNGAHPSAYSGRSPKNSRLFWISAPSAVFNGEFPRPS